MKSYWELNKNENNEIITLKKGISEKELELLKIQYENTCEIKAK